MTVANFGVADRWDEFHREQDARTVNVAPPKEV
jgi:hypothetical protein